MLIVLQTEVPHLCGRVWGRTEYFIIQGRTAQTHRSTHKIRHMAQNNHTLELVFLDFLCRKSTPVRKKDLCAWLLLQRRALELWLEDSRFRCCCCGEVSHSLLVWPCRLSCLCAQMHCFTNAGIIWKLQCLLLLNTIQYVSYQKLLRIDKQTYLTHNGEDCLLLFTLGNKMYTWNHSIP